MPRLTQRSQREVDSSDEDGQEQASLSQKRSSKRKGGEKKEEKEKDEISANIKKNKVDEVIRYCLACNQNQKPVQRQDIVKHCLGKEHGNLFNDIMEEVKQKLRSIFGVEILESEDKRGFYYLVNAMSHTDFLPTSKEQQMADALLYAILSNIFMRNPVDKMIDESNLNAFLAKLGIEEINGNHRIFGDVQKLIFKKFVEQGWLEIGRQTEENGKNEMVIGWGRRAYLVLRRSDILGFAAEVLFDDRTKLGFWVEHQEVAEEEDENDDGGRVVAQKQEGRKGR